MIDEGALLEAIYAAPERDEPRLVYADWLLDRGDPRGEFIQLQLAQFHALSGSAEANRLKRRIDVLWAEHWAAWTPKVDASGQRIEWEFSRGFATRAQTEPPDFVAAIDAYFEAAPLLEEVSLSCQRLGPLVTTPLAWLEKLVAAPAFARVKTLGLYSLNDAGVVALSGLPALGRLEGLELGRSNLGAATFEVLGDVRSPLRGLRRLELMMANARDQALERLLRLPWPKLESLAINNEVVGERGIAAIVEEGTLPALNELDLSWSQTGGTAAIKALVQSGLVARLRVLDLSHCDLTDRMCAELAKAGTGALQVLRLAHAGIGAASVEALLESPLTAGLRLFDLTGTRLEDAEREALAARLGERVLV